MEIRLVPTRENSGMVWQRALSKSSNPLLDRIQRLLASGQIDRQHGPTAGMNDFSPWNKKVALWKFLPALDRLNGCGKPLAPEKSHALVGSIQERKQIPQAATPQFPDCERLSRTGTRSPEDLRIHRGGIQPQRRKAPQILKFPLEAADAGKGNPRPPHEPTQVRSGSCTKIRAVMKNHRV